jgi:hypothetical protein
MVCVAAFPQCDHLIDGRIEELDDGGGEQRRPEIDEEPEETAFHRRKNRIGEAFVADAGETAIVLLGLL